MTRWIRAALADGKLKECDPVFAATLLQGQVKAMAFWPQVTMGAPPLAPELHAAVSMFLSYFAQAKHAA
ncbi:TetR/AcrR family transcriptional regulator C-terminal domain-containing protein [Massilia scottii]|uniref:TetR/AcrR family transcriptional regulator C-terminal domain-containing protein n=1 Tax=Massilia scottii TaxID=3057166 RepID=UPI0035B67003